MEGFGKLPRDAKVVLVGAAVYAVVSLLNWQHWRIAGYTIVQSEWYGIGILAGVLNVALLFWELARLVDAQFTLRVGSKPATSLGLALLLALFTLITFLSHADGRSWPAWVGLAVAFVIAAAAWERGRREGVQLQMPGT